jgi:hypothetical protein
MPLRVLAFRLSITTALVVASAIGAGWKWEGVTH